RPCLRVDDGEYGTLRGVDEHDVVDVGAIELREAQGVEDGHAGDARQRGVEQSRGADLASGAHVHQALSELLDGGGEVSADGALGDEGDDGGEVLALVRLARTGTTAARDDSSAHDLGGDPGDGGEDEDGQDEAESAEQGRG